MANCTTAVPGVYLLAQHWAGRDVGPSGQKPAKVPPQDGPRIVLGWAPWSARPQRTAGRPAAPLFVRHLDQTDGRVVVMVVVVMTMGYSTWVEEHVQGRERVRERDRERESAKVLMLHWTSSFGEGCSAVQCSAVHSVQYLYTTLH